MACLPEEDQRAIILITEHALAAIAPLSGWVLGHIVELDVHHPGFAGHYIRASAERRQTVAAYLAVVETSATTAGEQSAFLVSAGHRAILAHAYGSVPTGFRGALRRAGPQPHCTDFYSMLHGLLHEPPHPKLAPAIHQLTTIDLNRLGIARALSPDLCNAGVIERLVEEDHARSLSILVQRMGGSRC